MAVSQKELEDLIVGKRVIISDCEGARHAPNPGCLCALKGTVQTVGRRYEATFAGTASWWLEGQDKRVRLSEITLVL